MTPFKAGDEAVFIDNGKEWIVRYGGEAVTLHHKHVYKITGVEVDSWFHSGVGLLLEGFGKNRFDAVDFRPIVKTNISIFTAMLQPTPQWERVE